MTLQLSGLLIVKQLPAEPAKIVIGVRRLRSLNFFKNTAGGRFIAKSSIIFYKVHYNKMFTTTSLNQKVAVACQLISSHLFDLRRFTFTFIQ